MKTVFSVLILIVILTGDPADGSVFSGVLKPKFSLTDQPSPDSSLQYVLQSPLRLKYHHRTGIADLNIAWVLVPSAGKPALSAQDGSGVFRLADPEGRILPAAWDGTGSFSLIHDIDRLNARFYTSFATFTAGRQAIYWGVAKSVSPTDFIAPYQYGTLDTEYRIGVDAVRSVFPLGIMSELDAGYLFGRDAQFSRSGFWLRGRFYILQTDATLLSACFRENLMVGASLNRSIGQGTGWVECAYVSTGFFSGNGIEETFWSLSTGYERSWLNASLYGFLEYHFSSPGTDDPADYPVILNSGAFTTGGIYLLGKHYISPGINWAATPLLNFSGQTLLNLSDMSAYLSLSSEYSMSQNTVLNAGVSRGLGENPDEPAGNKRSEFGSWPGYYFISAGYYF